MINRRVISIETLSPTAIPRGDESRSAADIDLTVDEFGAPYDPARRIQAMLHESWEKLAPAHPHLTDAAEAMLGVTRSFGGHDRLGVGTAALPKEDAAWIRWAVTRPTHPVSATEIEAAFACHRYMTARDRRRGGAAMANSLRHVRCLRSGVVLHAPLLWPTALDTPTHRSTFARICLATRHIHLGRNRGFGHVALRLLEDGQDKTFDWFKEKV